MGHLQLYKLKKVIFKKIGKTSKQHIQNVIKYSLNDFLLCLVAKYGISAL